MDNQPSESKPKGPHLLRLEEWCKKEKDKGLIHAHVSHLTNEDVERWNKLTEEERAKEIMDFIEAPTIPDPDLF